MAVPARINLQLYKGTTFCETIKFESSNRVYNTITAIPNTAPLTITVPNHIIPSGWRVKISNVLGMTELNTNNYITVTSTSPNYLVIDTINPVGYRTYTGGGIVEYNAPVVLTNITGRMRIIAKGPSQEILDELTTDSGEILVDDTTGTITILISAETTDSYSFRSATYTLDLISGTTVIPLSSGNLTVSLNNAC